MKGSKSINATAYVRNFIKAAPIISISIEERSLAYPDGIYSWVTSKGEFPRNVGTTLTETTIGRPGFDQASVVWSAIPDSDGLTFCSQPNYTYIKFPTSTQRNTTMQHVGLRSDPICIPHLQFRHDPLEEIDRFERGFIESANNITQDKFLLEYLSRCETKAIWQIPDDVISAGNEDLIAEICGNMQHGTSDFEFVRFPTVDNLPGQIDPRFLLVKIDPRITNWRKKISQPTVDMAVEASTAQQYDTDAFVAPEIRMVDFAVPSAKTITTLSKQERELENTSNLGLSRTDEDVLKMKTKAVFRSEVSARVDQSIPRYAPDNTYNASLVATAGYAFDADDPLTWARLIRIYPFKVEHGTEGRSSSVPNPDFPRAPFAICYSFSPRVMSYYHLPVPVSYGMAKIDNNAEVNMKGDIKFMTDDEGTSGYYQAKYGYAFKTDSPEYGFAFLVRLVNSHTVQGTSCEVPSITGTLCKDGNDTSFPFSILAADGTESTRVGATSGAGAVRESSTLSSSYSGPFGRR